MAHWSGDRAVMTCLRVFRHIRKEVRYDAQAMELIVCSNIIREQFATAEDERRIWLSYMDRE
jgi:hypothetical protein